MVAYVVIGLGLVTSVVLTVLALRAGRERPVHGWLWGMALAGIGASLLFHAVIAGVTIAGGDTGFGPAVLMGTLALAGILFVAVWRPLWAGWALIGTGIGIPVLLWLLQALVGTDTGETLPVDAMIGFYGLPGLITGAVLLLSARHSTHALPTGGTPASVQ